MPPHAENHEPSLVTCPSSKPNGKTYFDWNDKALQDWIQKAIHLQDAHVKDNNRTKWFKYDSITDKDALKLRVLMAMFGVRTPTEKNKVPSCAMRTYTSQERKDAQHIVKCIVKNSSDTREVKMNIAYVSTANKVKKEDAHLTSEEAVKLKDVDEVFLATEVPLFVVDGKHGQLSFIEKDGRTYSSFEDFKSRNQLPKGPMLFPRGGTYTSLFNQVNGRVALDVAETPSTEFLPRLKAVTDTVVMIAGIGLSVSGVVTCFAPSLLTKTVAMAMRFGSFALSGYSILNTSVAIYDKTRHDQSIRTEVLTLTSSLFTMYVSGVSKKLAERAKNFAREGRTLSEFLQSVGTFKKALFLFTFFSSASALVSALFELAKKRERTWLDYFQFSMSLFMFVNVVTKPITLKGLFEKEQMAAFNELKGQIEQRLNEAQSTDQAKEELNKMAQNVQTSDDRANFIRELRNENTVEYFESKAFEKLKRDLEQKLDDANASEEAKRQLELMAANCETVEDKVYFIRNLTRITDPAEFFDLIASTESTVLCTADGLEINKNIVISPEAYESIGKDAFNQKLNQMMKCSDKLPKDIVNGFLNGAELNNETQEKINRQLENVEEQYRKQTESAREKKANAEAQMKSSKERLNNLKGQDTSDAKKEYKNAQIELDNAKKELKNAEDELKNASDNRKEGIKKIIDPYMTDEAKKNFENDWENSLKNEKTINKSFNDMMKEFGDFPDAQGANKEKFQRLQELAQRKLDGTITVDEEAMLKESVKECSKERKRHFFNSSQGNLTSEEEIKKFKDDVKTFTSARNERLCYRINVEEVRGSFETIAEKISGGQRQLQDLEVQGKRIFSNMKTSDYDRINRAGNFGLGGQITPETFEAAIKVANDPKFQGVVNTPNDIVSIAEMLHKEGVISILKFY